jgi:hypothetical protein
MTDYHLTGYLSRARGVIGRYPNPGDRYILEWSTIADRPIHMVGVTRPLIVEWHQRGAMVRREQLRPWVGRATHPADRVIEYAPDQQG